MSDNLDDSLSRRLSSLESDLAGISLPGPAAARHRAAQRTRHQVTGGVLAGVAAVALGVFTISPPEFVASPEPVDTPSGISTPTAVPTTPTESPSTPPVEPEPDPDPSEAESPDGGGQNGSTGNDGTSSLVVPPGALIGVDYLLAEHPGSSWAEVPSGNSWLPCAPAFADTAAAVSYEAGGNARFDHTVEPVGPADADERLEGLRQELTDCADSGGDHQLMHVWHLTGVGDEGYLMAWSGPPTTEETATFVTASLVRTDGFVTVVLLGAEGQDYNYPPTPEDAVEAITVLCEVSDIGCPSTPEQEQLYPEPVGNLDGWLTFDDLAEAGLTGLGAGDEVTADGEEYGPEDYGLVFLARSPLADGAQTLERRQYYDPLQPPDIQLTQLRATFPDAASARQHYEQLVAEADGFQQSGDVIENTGGVSGDDYEGMTWRATSGYGGVFLYGAAIRGAVVTVVEHSITSHSDGLPYDVTGEQMQGLVERAAQRIGG